MAQQRETIFKEKVLSDLRYTPYVWAEKIQQRAKSGTPDFMVCAAGMFVALELKLDEADPANTRTMALQDRKMAVIRECLGVAWKIDPASWPGALENLENLIRQRIGAVYYEQEKKRLEEVRKRLTSRRKR